MAPPERTWRFDLNPGPGEAPKSLAKPLGFNPGALIDVSSSRAFCRCQQQAHHPRCCEPRHRAPVFCSRLPDHRSGYTAVAVIVFHFCVDMLMELQLRVTDKRKPGGNRTCSCWCRMGCWFVFSQETGKVHTAHTPGSQWTTRRRRAHANSTGFASGRKLNQ